MKKRVAFTLIGGKNWTGGYNYLLNLLRTLQTEAPGLITPVLLVGKDVSDTDLTPYAKIRDCEIIQIPLFNEDQRTKSLAKSLLWGRDSEVVTALNELKIDAIFEAAIFLGWRLNIPAIAWIPDFQHRYLPHLFSRTAWWKRELGINAQIRSGRMVMVSSEDSKLDCKKFYPAMGDRVKAVRFAVPPPSPLTFSAKQALANRYDLPEEYFFMPNQFWMHKNHLLVVRALEILKSRGQTVNIVATGKEHDPRNINYVPELKAAVTKAGVDANFRMLGLIPYEDLLPMMQASTALLNPSLFEGWSTTVEEAKSAGVPLLLSDLNVHKEQAGSEATFFDRDSADALAECLSNFIPPTPTERLKRSQIAATEAITRVNRFAKDFIDLIMIATERNRPA